MTEGLTGSSDFLRFILNNINDAIFIHQVDGTVLDVNEKMLTMYNMDSKESAVKLSISREYSGPNNPLEQLPLLWEKVLQGENQLFQWQAKRPGDGSLFEAEVFLCKLSLDNKDLIMATVRDVSPYKEVEEKLRSQQELFRCMVEYSPFPLAILQTSSNNYEYLNPKFTEVFGYTLEDIPSGRDWLKLAYPDPAYRKEVIAAWLKDLHNYQEGEARIRVFKVTCKDGQVKDILFRPVTTKDGRQFITYEDVSERKRAEEHIKYLSYHDKLTGLYNRAFFEEELKRLDTERQLPLTIIIGDINDFKLVNDNYGHKAGDEFLVKIANNLKSACRNEDIVCRWGGDEFAILLPLTPLEVGKGLINRINKALSQADQAPIPPRVAFGVATKNTPAEKIEEVLIKADSDMYLNKAKLKKH